MLQDLTGLEISVAMKASKSENQFQAGLPKTLALTSLLDSRHNISSGNPFHCSSYPRDTIHSI